MGTFNGLPVEPKVWEEEEYGVLPMFCYNVHKSVGDEIALHFFEPRYLRLLRIACETQTHCFIYTITNHPRNDTTAWICSINAISGTDIQGIITNTVKVNQSWVDMQDRLWWCRFQVVEMNPIPVLQIECSPNFAYTPATGDNSMPKLTFSQTEDKICNLYYDPSEEIRMYSCWCTLTMKQAIIEASTNKSDPEYNSLKNLPTGTIWYVLPETSQKGVDCRSLAQCVERLAEELTGSTTPNDLISMLVNLEVASVKKIWVTNVTADIIFAANQLVRCPMRQQSNKACFIAKVDFGITMGNFSPGEVVLTPSASKRIFQQITRKVNQDRLRLLSNGHISSNSPLKKLPSPIIDKLKSFLIYM